MTKPTEKTIFEQRTKCPYCSKQIVTRLVRNTIKPGTPAQTELLFFAEKEQQTTLEEDYQESLLSNSEKIRRQHLKSASWAEEVGERKKKTVKRKGF